MTSTDVETPRTALDGHLDQLYAERPAFGTEALEQVGQSAALRKAPASALREMAEQEWKTASRQWRIAERRQPGSRRESARRKAGAAHLRAMTLGAAAREGTS